MEFFYSKEKSTATEPNFKLGHISAFYKSILLISIIFDLENQELCKNSKSRKFLVSEHQCTKRVYSCWQTCQNFLPDFVERYAYGICTCTYMHAISRIFGQISSHSCRSYLSPINIRITRADRPFQDLPADIFIAER